MRYIAQSSRLFDVLFHLQDKPSHGGNRRFRVARLPFLMPNFRNLAFFKVVWHEKMLLGMFLAFFSGVDSKKMLFGIFKKLVCFQFIF